jgi:hypothetical protein
MNKKDQFPGQNTNSTGGPSKFRRPIGSPGYEHVGSEPGPSKKKKKTGGMKDYQAMAKRIVNAR